MVVVLLLLLPRRVRCNPLGGGAVPQGVGSRVLPLLLSMLLGPHPVAPTVGLIRRVLRGGECNSVVLLLGVGILHGLRRLQRDHCGGPLGVRRGGRGRWRRGGRGSSCCLWWLCCAGLVGGHAARGLQASAPLGAGSGGTTPPCTPTCNSAAAAPRSNRARLRGLFQHIAKRPAGAAARGSSCLCCNAAHRGSRGLAIGSRHLGCRRLGSRRRYGRASGGRGIDRGALHWRRTAPGLGRSRTRNRGARLLRCALPRRALRR